MRLKSFHGSTLNEAMRNVREALGDDAIIVATRDDEAGGFRVTAALDDAPFENPEPAEDAEFLADGETAEVIASALAKHRVPQYISERLIATTTQFADEEPMVALGAALDAHLKFSPIKDEGKYIVIGLHGAGKTLCAAKLATKATMEKRPASLVSADTERAGGMEQLAAFARLLKIDMTETEDEHALHDAVEMQPKGNSIFIDTPGINPYDEDELKFAERLVKASAAEAILITQADMDADEAVESAKKFASIGATAITATRLDTTRRLGGLVRLAYETKMPLGNFSASAKVTEPPIPMNPVALSRLILRKE